MDTWRVIYDGKNTASHNMAADAYLLEAAENGGEKPVLRLYGWDQPSITIGFHQKFERAVDLAYLGMTPVIRRITGGRALLHDDNELTYAMAGNFARYPCLGSSLHETYNMISGAVVSFYNSLGWPASISHRDHPVSLTPSLSIQKGCFASVSQYEIIVDGQKVAAGSQRRTRTSFMQHGSLKFGVPTPHRAISEIPQAVEPIHIKGIQTELAETRSKLTKAFEKIFKVEFISGPVLEVEKAAIRDLLTHFENLNLG